MDGTCRYFDSDRWTSRLWAHLNRVETIESFLDTYTTLDDIEGVLADLGARLDVGYVDLLETDVEAVLSAAPRDLLPVRPAEVPPVWAELQDLPRECPHDPFGTTDFCLFHLPSERRRAEGVSPEAVASELVDRTADDGPTAERFVGAEFRRLGLDGARIGGDDGRRIDLRLAVVEEECSLANATIDATVDLTGATLADVDFGGSTLTGDATFDAVRFSGSAAFDGCEFRGRARYPNAVFDGASFEDVTFDERADFEGATFDGEARFARATFEQRGYFKSARFEAVTFKRASFHEKASFKRARFRGPATFPRTRFVEKASFKFARFGDLSVFEVARFGSEAFFWDATFEGRAWFTGAEFEHDGDFSAAGFYAGGDEEPVAYFNDVTFGRNLLFESVATRAGGVVSFARTTLTRGRISQPTASDDRPGDGPTYYDLTESVLGDVGLAPVSDPDLFSYFYFYETDFDGFDFGDHRQVLNEGWAIHTFAGEPGSLAGTTAGYDDYRVGPGGEGRERGHGASIDVLENTYLKAKNGANEVGDATAASEFFLREMRYRRRGHLRNARDAGRPVSDRVVSFGRWVSSWFYNASSGYGERPMRPILFSLGLVVLFAATYSVLGIGVAGVGTPVSYLAFSFQVFVTLILGGPPEIPSPAVRLLTSFEAFVGAFFIALFVFALTRSIHR
jgi:uncharacterized protein YjbI with pentapeptide repeats